MNNYKDYINKVGIEGAFRLHILNEVHGSYSRDFLKRAGLKSDMVVLDLGCGIGTMSCWIANQLKDVGKVYAIDSSAEQIELAKKNAELKGITNIEFIQASVFDLDKLEIAFDLIYSRYFLLHLRQIEEALTVIFNKLKPEGIIACEEPTINTGFCYPISDAYKKSRQLIMNLAEIQGLDFEIGLKLHEKLANVGFVAINVNLVQPTLKNSYERKLLNLMIKEYSKHYIQHNLSTQEEILTLMEALEELSFDESVLIGFPRTTQAYAQKK